LKNYSIKVVALALMFVLSNIFAQDLIDNKTSLTYLKSNLYFLASDELEGRETATRGEILSSMFIASELEKYGILPFGDNGTYFQTFQVIETKFAGQSLITLYSDNKEEVIEAGDDFIYVKFILPDNEYAGKKYDLVFAGYGLTSEESDYDDYKNIDATNKVVIVKSGQPVLFGESPFSDAEVERFNKGNYKLQNAINHGAAGFLVMPDEMMTRYWKYLLIDFKSASMSLESSEKQETTIPVAIISNAFAERLLADESITLTEIDQKIKAEEPVESFQLKKQIMLLYNLSEEKKYARNVLGILPGKDEELKYEIVSMGAHYDHDGISNGEIYNGADDNGSGTVAILETARKLAIINDNDRPILFVFHAGEEKGLLGSSYLTDNSPFVKNIISNINIDMVGRESEDSIYCIGSKMLSTELSELVVESNEETVNIYLDYKFDDPNDPNKYYYRSDHYNYAKKGIPVVFFYDHMTIDYHQPSDTVEKINFNKINKISNLITNLSLKIANLDHKLVVDAVENLEMEK
jgi:hypothetical protein